MDRQYLAHIRVFDDGKRETQTCKMHCEKTAAYAEKELASVGYGRTAYLAGILHDMGKWKDEFRTYLERSANGEKVVRGSVIHSFAGVRYILKEFHHNGYELDFDDLTAELIGYAIGGHHGLFDIYDCDASCGFTHRLDKIPAGDEAARSSFLSDCMDKDALSAVFQSAVTETKAMLGKTNALSCDGDEAHFHTGLLVRLLSAAVIEGDRRDTAEFMSDAVYPAQADRELWARLLKHVEQKLNGLSADTEINRMRRKISDECRDFARGPSGIYRLNVPTGGGKTLSALRYALAHAAQHDKKRIIFAFPLLSITEQNANVIRDAVGDDSLILEHHSDVVNTALSDEDRVKYDLLCESWEQPIIITTSVMLLSALFDGKTSSVRRFHALTDAVIVIDEVQTISHRMLTMFNLAVQFLATVCNTTVVLCSATQPYDASLSHPIRNAGTMIPYRREIWDVFKRTEIMDAGAMVLADISDFIRERMNHTNSLLVVCNKRSEATTLYRLLSDGKHQLFHLSASMCIAHRKKTVSALRQALASGNKIICVSTQVIEAGVDISFGTVVRLTAGMDSVIQSAGRCNRNGESDSLCPVYVIRCYDEQLGMLRDIKAAKEATEELLIQYHKNPEAYASDLGSEAAIRDYYDILFGKENRYAGAHDYPIKGLPSLFDMLSENVAFMPEEPTGDMQFCLHQAFATAGRLFEVFDDASTAVIVPYGDGRELITALCSEKAMKDISYCRKLLRQAREYSVNLYSYQIKMLSEARALTVLADGAALGLREEYYDEKIGFLNLNEEVNAPCNIPMW